MIYIFCKSNPLFSTIQSWNYAIKKLPGDLVETYKTDEDIEKLMDTDNDNKRRIDQLVKAMKATEQAMEIVGNLKKF